MIAKFHFIILVDENCIWNYLTSFLFSFPGKRIALLKMKFGLVIYLTAESL